MRVIVQRVSSASVKVDGKIVGEISKGFLLLLGVEKEDTINEAKMLAEKVANLRIFSDENDKMNLSLLTVDGEALVVSNFTLYANCKKGTRPSFIRSAGAEVADNLYNHFCECLKEKGIKKVEKGIFGADMKVNLVNDGPITMQIDTDELKPKGNN